MATATVLPTAPTIAADAAKQTQEDGNKGKGKGKPQSPPPVGKDGDKSKEEEKAKPDGKSNEEEKAKLDGENSKGKGKAKGPPTPTEKAAGASPKGKGKGKGPPVPGGPGSPKGKGKDKGKAKAKTKAAAKPAARTTPKTKPLGWRKLEDAGEGSMWSKAQSDLEIKVEDIATLFSWGNPAAGDKKKSVSAGDQKSSKVSLCSGQRSMAICIGLKTMGKDLTCDRLREAIIALDPEVLTAEVTERLLEKDSKSQLPKILPTSEEILAAQAHLASDMTLEVLEDASRFIVAVHNIPLLRDRLQLHHFRLDFDHRMGDLRKKLKTLKDALNQVKGSGSFSGILMFILKIGNLLNECTDRGNAAGFRMDSLAFLAMIKQTPTPAAPANGEKAEKPAAPAASNANLTLLDFVVAEIARQRPTLFAVSDEMADVAEATRTELEDVERQIGQVKNENDRLSRAISKDQSNGSDSSVCADSALESAGDFLKSATDQISELESEVPQVREHYRALKEDVFGEEAKGPQDRVPLHEWLGYIHRFLGELKKAELALKAREEQKAKREKMSVQRAAARKVKRAVTVSLGASHKAGGRRTSMAQFRRGSITAGASAAGRRQSRVGRATAIGLVGEQRLSEGSAGGDGADADDLAAAATRAATMAAAAKGKGGRRKSQMALRQQRRSSVSLLLKVSDMSQMRRNLKGKAGAAKAVEDMSGNSSEDSSSSSGLSDSSGDTAQDLSPAAGRSKNAKVRGQGSGERQSGHDEKRHSEGGESPKPKTFFSEESGRVRGLGRAQTMDPEILKHEEPLLNPEEAAEAITTTTVKRKSRKSKGSSEVMLRRRSSTESTAAPPHSATGGEAKLGTESAPTRRLSCPSLDAPSFARAVKRYIQRIVLRAAASTMRLGRSPPRSSQLSALEAVAEVRKTAALGGLPLPQRRQSLGSVSGVSEQAPVNLTPRSALAAGRRKTLGHSVSFDEGRPSIGPSFDKALLDVQASAHEALHKRFPSASKEQVRHALHMATGHPGRAASALRKYHADEA